MAAAKSAGGGLGAKLGGGGLAAKLGGGGGLSALAASLGIPADLDLDLLLDDPEQLMDIVSLLA